MKLQRTVLCAVAILWAAASSVSGQTSSSREALSYYYFKECIEVRNEDNEVALLLDDKPSTAVAEEIAADPLAPSERSEFQIPGNWLVVRGKEMRNSKSLREFVKGKLKNTRAKYVTPIVRTKNGDRLYFAPRIMIGFEKTATEAQISKVLGLVSNTKATKKLSAKRHRYAVEVSSKDGLEVLDLANRLATMEGVLYSHPDIGFQAQTSYVPTDPLFNSAWHLRNTGQQGGLAGFDIGATSAWDVSRGTSTVKVVIMDSGVEIGHPDLAGKISDVKNFASDGPLDDVSPRVNEYHGTAVAGCTTAGMNNFVGSTAVAPDVRLAIARIGNGYNSSGQFFAYSSWIANAIYWSQTIGASVTNFSNGMGGGFYADVAAAYADTREGVNTSTQTTAYGAAAPKGIVHFASAGNSHPASIGFPANLPSVNAVGAVDRFGQRAYFSQVGETLDLVAPGVEIVTTDIQGSLGYNGILGYNDFGSVNGTSFASPVAAGVAALIASRYPEWTAQQIENQIRRYTQRSGGELDGQTWPNTTFGNGLVRADLALQGTNWQLFNISNRGYSQSGGEVMIMGFVVSGTQPKKVLLRAVGPELAQFGVTGLMPDPKILLYNNNGSEIFSNDDWNLAGNPTEIRDAAESVGAFPLTEGSKSASLLVTLSPGLYSMHMLPGTGAGGVGIAEVYDADAGFESRFINVSTLGKVQTGSGVLIGGIVIQGTGPRRVLIRGIGPTLGGFGVSGALQDSTLTVYRHNPDGTTTVISENDNWGSNSNASEIASVSQQVGAFALPQGSEDAALLLLLEPGLYSAHVNGKNGTTGTGLAEAYAVDP